MTWTAHSCSHGRSPAGAPLAPTSRVWSCRQLLGLIGVPGGPVRPRAAVLGVAVQRARWPDQGCSGLTGEFLEVVPVRAVLLEGDAQFLGSGVVAVPGG